MEIRKRIKAGIISRLPRRRSKREKEIRKRIRKKILVERKAIKIENIDITVSTLDKMWHDLDSKSVIMGTINFLTARLTGYKWFKDKIKVSNDQSVWSRLVELLKFILNRLKGVEQ